jgi:phospholipid/cholesterol/gamma-HCH transport system permease protein
MIRLFGRTILLLHRALRGLVWSRGLSSNVVHQVAELGFQSIALVISGLSLFGMVMALLAFQQARKYTGNVTVVGPAYFELMLREFAPMMVALLVAARNGSSISAEIASMSVNEQIDALTMSGIDAAHELVAPRIFASVLVLPCLSALGTLAAAGSAAATISLAFGADGSSFLSARFVDWGDMVCALIKSWCCGLFIPLAAASRGLAAKFGAAAVGEAVTGGVIDACSGCLLLDFAIAAMFLVGGR